ncbi:hypothetical protein [Nonomuraea typhae]|uniref:hypothetical protein n=1 Tax=Nonomuraea typhae TaxID=2603600 RepID=UPI0012FA6709|nr:hypothetical protein [Nonomuraea typhae]
MPAPAVAEVLQTTNGRTTTEVLNTAAGTAVGDTLVIVYASDFFALATMPEATSSAGTLSAVRTIDIGTNLGHIKTYTCAVTSGGSHTVTIPAHSGCDIFGVVLRLSTAATVDAHDGQIDPTESTTSHVAPSVTTTGADRLLVACWLGTNVNTGWSSPPYTAPGSMTDRAQPNSSPFSGLLVATQEIAAAGATGTRTATFFRDEAWGSISIALAGPATATALPPSRRQPLGALIQL